MFYSQMAQFLSTRDLECIFSNLEDILITNSIILSEFDAAQVSSNYIVNNIGELFQKHVMLSQD
jgi:hypothetical protein